MQWNFNRRVALRLNEHLIHIPVDGEKWQPQLRYPSSVTRPEHLDTYLCAVLNGLFPGYTLSRKLVLLNKWGQGVGP